VTPEFSRSVRPESAPPGGQTLRLVATDAERAALARRFGLPAVVLLEAELELRPAHGGRARATGRLRAQVEQFCVVTLEPFGQSIEEPLDFVLLAPGEEPDEEALDPDAPDEVEQDGAGCDLGEAVAQTLSLALDPHPRKPGAELDAAALRAGEANPLAAALAKLRPGE
jgi:uncharacterized metal-binding protein YceD (DUF177 family)